MQSRGVGARSVQLPLRVYESASEGVGGHQNYANFIRDVGCVGIAMITKLAVNLRVVRLLSIPTTPSPPPPTALFTYNDAYEQHLPNSR